jgi:hypothetical protein
MGRYQENENGKKMESQQIRLKVSGHGMVIFRILSLEFNFN